MEEEAAFHSLEAGGRLTCTGFPGNKRWAPLKGGLARAKHGSGGSVKPDYNRGSNPLCTAYKVNIHSAYCATMYKS